MQRYEKPLYANKKERIFYDMHSTDTPAPRVTPTPNDFVQLVMIVGSLSARMASNPRERGLFRLLD